MKTQKVGRKKIPTFLCFMEVEKHIDKEQIKIAAMETDLANKERDLEKSCDLNVTLATGKQ